MFFSWFFQRTGFQRTGNPIGIHGWTSINEYQWIFINEYGTLSLVPFPLGPSLGPMAGLSRPGSLGRALLEYVASLEYVVSLE